MPIALRRVISLIIFMIGTVALPAAASDQPIGAQDLQSSILAAPPIGSDMRPEILTSDSGCLTLGELVALVAGAVIVGTAADIALGNGPFPFLGMVAGAALGSIWYKQGM
jgi:hypothetical protein